MEISACEKVKVALSDANSHYSPYQSSLNHDEQNRARESAWFGLEVDLESAKAGASGEVATLLVDTIRIVDDLYSSVGFSDPGEVYYEDYDRYLEEYNNLIGKLDRSCQTAGATAFSSN